MPNWIEEVRGQNLLSAKSAKNLKKNTKRPCLLKSEEALPARHSLNLDLIPNSGGFLLLLLVLGLFY